MWLAVCTPRRGNRVSQRHVDPHTGCVDSHYLAGFTRRYVAIDRAGRESLKLPATPVNAGRASAFSVALVRLRSALVAAANLPVSLSAMGASLSCAFTT